jgi:hypothetical protein
MGFVVVVGHDHPDLDADRLDDRDAVGHRARLRDGLPDAFGVLGSQEQLVAELAAEPGAREPHRRAAHRDGLGEEREVPERVDVGPSDDRSHQLARPRPLDLQARQLGRDVLDLDVEPLGRVGEVVGAVVPVRADPEPVRGVTEHRAVVHEQPVLVDERAVAHLAVPHPQDVVRVHALGGLERVGTLERPLVQRREVPHADALAHRAVLRLDVAEARDPQPARLLLVSDGGDGGDRVEGGLATRHGRVIPRD